MRERNREREGQRERERVPKTTSKTSRNKVTRCATEVVQRRLSMMKKREVCVF